MSSFGWFPGVWFVIADVSEHSICSIVLGRRFETSNLLPRKMEQIECFETSAIINQTPRNHQKEDIVYVKYFLRKITQIFALILLLNIRYLMLVICDIRPSCLLRSDVILLKIIKVEMTQIRDTMINDQISNFFPNDNIF
jgi:hypothetical protein